MKPTVFYYHRVGHFRPGAPLKMNVSPEHFRGQMRVLKETSNPVSLDQMIDPSPLPPCAVAVSFDDGYRDLMEHALPVLVEMKIPAAFFIVTGGIGQTDAWNEHPDVPREPILSWDDLARLRDAGMIVGSHSATHPVMDGLEESKLASEAGESRRALESKLGIKVRHFAYPQGRFSAAAEKAVRDAGYDAGWATRKGRPLSSGERYAISRVAVSSYITNLRFRWEHWVRRLGLKR